MKKTGRNLILALETGIDGGSVTVLDGKKMHCSAEGKASVSKAEDLLLLIEDLLKENGLNKREIEIIAVSDSPGSLTGLRIGLATARGLANSFGAKICKIPILEAQIKVAAPKGRTVSALFSEKNGIYYQVFDSHGEDFIAHGDFQNERNLQNFIDYIKNEKCSYVFEKKLTSMLFEKARRGDLFGNNEIHIIEGSLSECLGKAAFLYASDNV